MFNIFNSRSKPKRISLAYQDLKELPASITTHYAQTLEELDLTQNEISDFNFLLSCPRLETLILDGNGIHNHTKFPVTPSLHTLWLNHNDITNIGLFISTISKAFPNLRYLCLMNNEAAPSYFNGGSFHQYTDYRHYVISQFPKLETLDDRAITKEERAEATRIYSRPQAVAARSAGGKR